MVGYLGEGEVVRRQQLGEVAANLNFHSYWLLTPSSDEEEEEEEEEKQTWKAGVSGVQTPQIISDFPPKNRLKTTKS